LKKKRGGQRIPSPVQAARRREKKIKCAEKKKKRRKKLPPFLSCDGKERKKVNRAL